ncbi:short chain dehydrogenase [Oceanicola granulosus HTCC2516]|uniref:Short chain dehydrogenase n=1 Tax=Oceanicola granulosus (strain ATCC BAA-861 / DSM 15982 / KCTC 12143 / HTCC2516) TaxID=314256 RepID=Q2CGS0_OCEGH|nr:SDR family oxidoreductase [Oceanicola granulosus]EAR51865.1 short chain dehydrogenase [Oceanicola granulosus HTCC2516]
MDRLADKTAIVTGAARGIGAAIAEAFVAEGAKVVLADIDAEGAEARAAALDPGGERTLAVACDVADGASVARLAGAVAERFGAPHILVNNAGINVFAEPLDSTDADWARCMAVDLEGVWRVTRALLPAMLEGGGGAVVNIASTHSFSIIPGTFPYPVAKHGLLGLTRSLGIEFAARGVRVNAIAPGYVETELACAYWDGFDDPEAERRKTYEMHPPQRICDPREVAMTAVFLASDEAPFINATCITIDGGRSVLYHE